jgi:hypothetical protein
MSFARPGKLPSTQHLAWFRIARKHLSQHGETMSTDNNVKQYIDKRGELLADWRRKQQQQIMKTLAEKWIYIRVRGDTYRPVSIHRDNPCGSLKRLNGSGREIGHSKSLTTALNNADEAAPANAEETGQQQARARCTGRLDPSRTPA